MRPRPVCTIFSIDNFSNKFSVITAVIARQLVNSPHTFLTSMPTQRGATSTTRPRPRSALPRQVPDWRWEDWQRWGEKQSRRNVINGGSEAGASDEVEVIDLTTSGPGPMVVATTPAKDLTIADFDFDVDAWHKYAEELKRKAVIPSAVRSKWAEAHEGSGTTGLHIRTLKRGKRLTQTEVVMDDHDPLD